MLAISLCQSGKRGVSDLPSYQARRKLPAVPSNRQQLIAES
ncbi:hypothetical protein [Lyngbya aestuarii]